MNQVAATNLIAQTFDTAFDEQVFENFISNLLNHVDRDKSFGYRSGNIIPQAFREHISTYRRPFIYTDPNGERMDVLIVRVRKGSGLERARTMQRNFVAWYLKQDHDESVEAALIAFYHEDISDWRFSFVRLEYAFGDEGAEEELTPARRYSFLVGLTEPTHTAAAQLRPFLIEDAVNPSIDDLAGAFQIEVVSKQFFEEYKELFLQLVEGIEAILEKDKVLVADFKRAEIHVPNFAKKLLGQIVFLYFVQKKGWLGVATGKKWGSGPKDFMRRLFAKRSGATYRNYFNDVLEPLFYEALAVRRDGDLFIIDDYTCQIPFLNGGLFEPMGGYDWRNTNLLLPNTLFSNRRNEEDDRGTGVLDVFDRYNFTVWEEEPLEKEVAVDPEMLGKVFENLLEIQDRKSKGAFYTPREIVHYMCQESLINYLDTRVNLMERDLAKNKPVQTAFFGETKPQQKVMKTMTRVERVPLEDITILVRQGALALQQDAAKEAGLKSGDYVLPQTVRDHARELDVALATIRLCDPAIGSGAFPVGMLHEIVQARQALGTYLGNPNRPPYPLKWHAIQESIYGVDIDAGAVEIAKLRLWLSLVVDEENYDNIQPLPNLDYKIVCGNSLLKVEKNLFNNHLFVKLDKLQRLYFEETHRQEKLKLHVQIDQLIELITGDRTTFDFDIYFHEIFDLNNGFDVVIGNPPWLSLKGKHRQVGSFELYKQLAKLYELNSYSPNLYEVFLQRGVGLLRKQGVLAYIIPDRLGFNQHSLYLRKFLLQNTRICEIVYKWNFPQVIADTMTLIVQNRCLADYIFRIRNDTYNSHLLFHKSEILQDQELIFRSYKDEQHRILIEKIRVSAEKLGSLAQSTSGFGGKSSEITLIQQNRRQIQVYKGASIQRFQIVKPYYFEFVKKNITGRTTDKSKLGVKQKILLRKTGIPIIAAYDDSGTFPEQSLYFIYHLSHALDPMYLLGLLNSKLISWYYVNCLVTNLDSTPQLKGKDLDLFPIKVIPQKEQQPLIDLVREISRSQGSELGMSRLNILYQKLNQEVFRIYGLAPEEIALIEEVAGK